MGNRKCSKDGCDNLALTGENWCTVHKIEARNDR